MNIRQYEDALVTREPAYTAQVFKELKDAADELNIQYGWILILLLHEGGKEYSHYPYGIFQFTTVGAKSGGLDIKLHKPNIHEQIKGFVRRAKNIIRRYGKYRDLRDFLWGQAMGTMRKGDVRWDPNHIVGTEVSNKLARTYKRWNDPKNRWSEKHGVTVQDWVNQHIKQLAKFDIEDEINKNQNQSEISFDDNRKHLFHIKGLIKNKFDKSDGRRESTLENNTNKISDSLPLLSIEENGQISDLMTVNKISDSLPLLSIGENGQISDLMTVLESCIDAKYGMFK